jgi:Uma2 family endonuclease
MAIATQLTYEEYVNLPPIDGRYDIVDGELIMSPAPMLRHQWLIKPIMRRLDDFVMPRRLGIVLPAPVDVVVRRDPLRARQPDVLFLSAQRGGILGLRDLGDIARLEVAPELVVEILSDSDRWAVLEEKLTDYRAIGVTEAWLVDPESETVRVLLLSPDGDTQIGVFGVGDTLRSQVLPDLNLSVADIFADE